MAPLRLSIRANAGAQDTFYVGVLKGVGRICQQTFVYTFSKVAFAKPYDRKTPICAADLPNDQVIPFFDAHDVGLLCIVTDRGTEYCGNLERREHKLYLVVENTELSLLIMKTVTLPGPLDLFQ